MCNRITLLYTWNQYNIVNQLYFNKNLKNTSTYVFVCAYTHIQDYEYMCIFSFYIKPSPPPLGERQGTPWTLPTLAFPKGHPREASAVVCGLLPSHSCTALVTHMSVKTLLPATSVSRGCRSHQAITLQLPGWRTRRELRMDRMPTIKPTDTAATPMVHPEDTEDEKAQDTGPG